MGIASNASRQAAGLLLLTVAVLIGCPPIELRVSIDADSVEGAVEDCIAELAGEPCGDDVVIGLYVEGSGAGIREGACVAVQLAIVARPEEGETEWPADRRAFSTCVELAHDVSFGAALDDAVQASLAKGLTLDDVEAADDAFFVMGVFASLADSCACDVSGEQGQLVACSRLREDADDAKLFDLTCTQCSGRKVAKGGDSESCAGFAGADCFFEGCANVFDR